MAEALVIGIVGAESTGKTRLARELSSALAEQTGLRCTWIAEYLRQWCEREGRVPRIDEQAGIAREQHARIDAAAQYHDVVVADTTALMTAVYSQWVYKDSSLQAQALALHARCAISLLTALDLPWEADGLQREGAHVRAPIDAMVRALLAQHGGRWAVVSGAGGARLASALDAVAPLLRGRPAPRAGLFTRLAERDALAPQWDWVCEKCDSPECEHALLRAGRRNPA